MCFRHGGFQRISRRILGHLRDAHREHGDVPLKRRLSQIVEEFETRLLMRVGVANIIKFHLHRAEEVQAP